MSSLSPYITDLLYLHNCVIIPELGGFVANYKSAEIDEQREIVYPPSKSVVFNNVLKNDDGLLIHYVAHKKKLSYRAAFEWVQNQVKDIKHTLLTDGLVILQGLGAFYLDENQQFQFKTDLAENLLADAYGLTPVNLPFSLANKSSGSLKTVPIQQNEGLMKNKRTLLRVAAILGPILIIAALIPVGKEYFSNQQTQQAGISTKNEQPTSVESQKDSAKVDEIATQKKHALYYSEEEVAYEYHIIAGSYTKRKNAEILADKLKDQGNDATVLAEKGKFRVSLQKFGDRYKAIQKLDFLRKTSDKSYWVHKVKK